MKNNNKADAISHIDDDLLESALLMRQQLQQSTGIKKSVRIFQRIGTLAACLVIVAAIPIVILQSQRQQDTPITTIVTTTNAETTDKDNPPGHTPNFDEPTLEQIYAIEPLDQLFPRSGFDYFTLISSYHALPDDIIEQLSPGYNDSVYLETKFRGPHNSNDRLAITVSTPKYNQYTMYDPDTNHINKSYAYRAEDLTLEIVEQLYYDVSYLQSEYRYDFRINVMFGKYLVKYEYTGYDFTPEDLFNLITSAEYFRN